MIRRLAFLLGATLALAPSGLPQNFHPTDAELLAAAELGYRNEKPLSEATIFHYRGGSCVDQGMFRVGLYSPLLQAYNDGQAARTAFKKMPPVEDLRKSNGTVTFIVFYLSFGYKEEAHLGLRQGDHVFTPLIDLPSECDDIEMCYTQPIWRCSTGAIFAIDTKGAVTSREPARLLVRRTAPAPPEESFLIKWPAWSASPESDGPGLMRMPKTEITVKEKDR